MGKRRAFWVEGTKWSRRTASNWSGQRGGKDVWSALAGHSVDSRAYMMRALKVL